MLKLSRLTDYSIVILEAMPRDLVTSVKKLAKETTLPMPTVSKILKILSRSGIVTSTRGAKGGYKIAKPLDEISVLTIVHAIEGDVALTDCVGFDKTCCDYYDHCRIRDHWHPVNNAIKAMLKDITLDQFLKKQSTGTLYEQ